jgi:hypothetical protein
MLLQRIFQLLVVAAAIAAGLGYFSIFWTAILIFVAGSLAVSNGPGFDLAHRANQEGRLGVMPLLIFAQMVPWAVIAAIAYFITRAVHPS